MLTVYHILRLMSIKSFKKLCFSNEHYFSSLFFFRVGLLQGDFDWPAGEIEERNGGYFFAGDGYEWTSTITGHKSGVNVRVDKIKNVSTRPIALRTALSRFSFFGGEYEVFTQYNEWCGEGYGKRQSLVTEISAEGESVRNNSSASPFMALYTYKISFSPKHSKRLRQFSKKYKNASAEDS